MKERMNQWVTIYYKLLFDNKLPKDGIKLLNQLTGKLLGTFKNGIKKVFAISYNRVVNLEKFFVYINKHLFKYIGEFSGIIKLFQKELLYKMTASSPCSK